MKRILSAALSVMIFLSAFAFSAVTFGAADVSIAYDFTKPDKGYAEGKITLTAPAGTYWLYWADDTKALDGYYKIAKLTVSENSASHSMYAQTAIPVDATKLIAVKSNSEPSSKTVADADAVYSIPQTKLLGHKTSEKNYRFASYSDIHMDKASEDKPADQGGRIYYYDETHLRKAFDTAAARNVDFIVASGDYVNNNVDFGGISAREWKAYQKVLSESDYCNPVYEAIGNHELWQSVSRGTSDFIKATGLDGDTSSPSKAYFEKTLGGDHFIFMALEGGFYPDKTEEFTTEQLDWLEGLLEKYSGDGKNIYVIEHSLFYKYGAGDRTNAEPYYDIPLKDSQDSTKRLKTIFEKYKDVIFISGHTHIAFDAQYNYSDNNGTSAQMIHNSSVGGVRRVKSDGSGLDRNYKEDDTEGYIVDVFDDALLFNGAALYYNMYDPNCCYIVKPSAVIKGVVQDASTEISSTPETTAASTTAAETTVDTTAASVSSDSTATIESTSVNETTIANTEPTVAESTETSVVTEFTETEESSAASALPTEATEILSASETVASETENFQPEPEIILGDVNSDKNVSIKDVTMIQKHIAKLITFNAEQLKAGDVSGDGIISIKDATLIQKKLAYLITEFPAEKGSKLKTSATTLSNVKANLEKYYRYSSYDSYQALKKESRKASPDIDKLTSLESALLSVVDTNNVDGNDVITVYFENTNSWSKVCAYVWKGSSYEKKWPGNEMTYVGKNDGNKKIYKYTVNLSNYENIVFNDGTDSKKTKDIIISADSIAYYLSGSSVPYSVSSYNFKQSYIKGQ